MIVLDNNVVRKYASGAPDDHVVEYLTEQRTEPWGIPAIVLYEFLSYYDSQATRRRRRDQLLDVVDEVLGFDEATAFEAASLGTSLGAAGVSLDVADLFIAATARQHGGTLATTDRDDFDKPPIHELLSVDIVPTD